MLLSKSIFYGVKFFFILFASTANRILVGIEGLDDEIGSGLMFLKGFIEEEKIFFICVIIWDIESDVGVEEYDEVERMSGNGLREEGSSN